jgi:thiaminase/transcriptional activator TenA
VVAKEVVQLTFLEECLAFAGPVWDRYIHHPWIEALFAGQLSEARFRYWLAQDLPYLSERTATVAFPKVPPHNLWAKLEMEYFARASQTRVERRVLEQYGEVALSRWAARPRREAFINFMVRTVYEGTFGEICCSYYPCYCFCETFGARYLREHPTGLPDLQVEWIQQFNDPLFKAIEAATREGINEAGAHASPYDREKMMWTFLRATQHQIGTFDAAWNLSDPWPGEGQEIGVLAGAPISATGTAIGSPSR